ncbi:MAG: hypothetical protein HUJ25_14695 [Crocinitomicaceae bacterium]|nr:hypothetical protein [Crocinitomicaceae bacterium]
MIKLKLPILFTFFISSISFAQNDRFQMGEIISPSEDNDRLYKDLSVITSRFGVWLTDRVTVLGKIEGEIYMHIYLKKEPYSDKKTINGLLSFDEEMNLTGMYSLNEIIDSRKCKFRDVLIFGGEVRAFCSTTDKNFTDDYAALYTITLDRKTRKFSEAKKMYDIPKLGSGHDYSTVASANNKFLAVIGDIGTPGTRCHYSVQLYNENMELIYESIGVEYPLDDDHIFKKAKVSNTGIVYLFMEEREVLRVFDQGDEYLDLLWIDMKGQSHHEHFEFTGMALGKFDVIEQNGKDLFYVSYFEEENITICGIKLIDLSEDKVILNHSFKPEWIEPVLKRQMSAVPIDKVEARDGFHATQAANMLELLQYVNYDNYHVLVLGKSTNCISGGGGRGPTDDYAPDKAAQRGDLVFLKFGENGDLVSKRKIERTIVITAPSYEVLKVKENSISILYEHSPLLEEEDKSKAGMKKLKDNTFLYLSVLDLNSFSLSKPEMIEIKDEENILYWPWLKNCYIENEAVYTLCAAAKKKERLVKIEL